MPRIAGKTPEAKKRQGRIPLRVSEEAWPWQCFHFGLIASKTLRQYTSVVINHSIFFNKFIYLFIYFWLHWVFVTARGLSLVVASGGYSSLWCAGFSLWWLLLLQSTGSRHTGFSSCGTRASVIVAHGLSSCGSQTLEYRLSSCGTRG